jgi:hypothetical protein
MKKFIAVTALAAAAMQAPAHAEPLEGILSGVDFNFGGFGTAGLVHTNTDQAQFIRGAETAGSNKPIRANVDSNIGVQATARFAPWIAVTAQVFENDDSMTNDLSWLYLKLDPLDNLTFKLGRFEAPLFAISDSRDINYANTWIRPPQEVYGLASFEEVKGGEGTYTLPIASTRLKLTGYAGVGRWALSSGTSGDSTNLRGAEVRWESDWVTLRASYAGMDNQIGGGLHPKYEFAAYGAIVDRDNVVAQAELVRRIGPGPLDFIVAAKGWYVLGGYRIGKVLPYASYATTHKEFPGAFALSYNQQTTALGVRWDAFKSADLKFQVERVNPKGTPGISFVNVQPGFGNSDVNVVSLALDFVF